MVSNVDSGVIVTGDLFRFHIVKSTGRIVWHQADNVWWLSVLVDGCLGLSGATKAAVLDPCTTAPMRDIFLPPPNVSPSQWWLRHVKSRVPSAIEEYIARIVTGKLVIGFELPDNLQEVFERYAQAVVNIEISPIRFCDDLLLSLSCSLPSVQDCAWRARVSERELHWHAALMRSRVGRHRDPTIPSAKIAMIGAQTAADRALIVNGRIVSLADYHAEIDSLADDNDILLVCPHPFSDGEVVGLSALLDIPGIRVSPANSYRILASDKISTMVSISSSLLLEAPYFGVAAKRLGPSPSEPVATVRVQALGGGIADMLAEAADLILPDSNVQMPSGGTPLQDFLGYNWAASRLQDMRPALPAAALSMLPHTVIPGSEAWQAALVYGWHDPEPWGNWSRSIGVIGFDWPDDDLQSLLCILHLRSIVPSAKVQTVSIWSDGAQVARADIAAGHNFPIAFPVKRSSRPGATQIFLNSEQTLRPRDSMKNMDDRELGVGLSLIEFQ